MDPNWDNMDLPEPLRGLDAFLGGEAQTTLYQELVERGAAPVGPAAVSDEALPRALTNLIWSLYDLGVIVEDADHLSDRELYEELVELCRHPAPIVPDDPELTTHWSPIGACTGEDLDLWLRYYASETDRAYWEEEYSEGVMPPSELPPHWRSWLPHRSNLTDQP
jgi:hypothetical protein